MSKLDEQIAKQAAHIAQQVELGMPTAVNPGPPEYVEPNVRTMLTDRLRSTREAVSMTEALLEDLPESILNAPVSVFHRIF